MPTIDTIYCKLYSAGSVDTDWFSPTSTSGRFVAGYAESSKNWIGIIKFTLTKPASTVTFNFTNHSSARSSKQNLNFKISTKEDQEFIASIESSFNSGVNVPGDTTIKADYSWGTNGSNGGGSGQGSFQVYQNAFSKTQVTFNKIFSSGTYYIYVWSANFTVKSNVMVVGWQNSNGSSPFSASYIEYPGSVVYISDGTNWHTYEIWIYNGTDWDQYSAYINNGSSWEEYG